MRSHAHRPPSRSRLAMMALLYCFHCVAPAIAAESDKAPGSIASSPRIGLALSGGGARGLAHIGVLKVLEELRVPVHCVTGTSMGAIVGGAFASGGQPRDLEERVVKADWDEIFRDKPPRAEISIRRKTDDYKTLFAPEFGVKGGVVLPKGVIAGISIEAFFRQLTSASAGINDFNKLPVPYRAVAADIETGEAVVISRGSVAHAMRASMSVPGAMAPVEIDGRLLVDGGIANNLPIDEARKLCADVIIAVDISTPPMKREEITSALSVSLQLINFLGKQTVEQQLKTLTERDVLISPKLGNFSSGDFERSAEAIHLGEEATRGMAESLRRYSLPPDQYAALRAKQVIGRSELGTVDEIRFEGLERTNPEVLRSLVQSKPGEPLSEERVSADLRRIYGRGDFESVDYRIQQEPGGRIMLIHPREKDWGPDYLRFGLGLATDFKGEHPWNILLSYRKTWVNRLGGEWLTEAQMGRDPRLYTEFYQPIDERGRYFVAPYALYGESNRSIFADGKRVADYSVREGRIGVDVGATLATWGEVRVGPLWRNIDAHVQTGSPLLPSVEETSAGMRMRLFGDHLDNAFFARKGHRVIASALVADEGMGSDRNYKRFEGEFTGVQSWGNHTFNMNVAGGTDAGTNMPAYETFTLGGPLRLSGYRIGEFSGRRMSFARLMYYNHAIKLPDILGSGVYLGASLEAGQVHDRIDGQFGKGTLFSGSAFVAADTFMGPAYFGLGAGESGRWSLYLLLGVP